MDDIVVYGNSPDELQEDLHELQRWVSLNMISWNHYKCVLLPAYSLSPKANVYLDNHILKTVSQARYLGIIFSSNKDRHMHGFSFEDEAQRVISIIETRRHWLKLLSRSPPLIRKGAYQALITSRIDFSIQFLQAHLTALEQAQQKCLRFLMGTLPGVPWARFYTLLQLPPVENLFWGAWPKHFASWAALPETAPQPSAYRKWKVEKYRRYDSTPLSNMLWSEGLTADLLPDYERYDYTDHDQVSESQRKAAYEVILPPERPSRENWKPERLAEYQRDCRVTCWTDGSWDQRTKRGAASSVLQTP